MKRGITTVLVLVLLFSLTVPCLAAEDSSVSPRYSHISKVAYDLSINASGVATCTASCTALSPSYKVKVSCLLQGYTGSTWALLKSWSDTDYSYASVDQQASTRSSWTDYRIKVTFSIYDSSDNQLETVTYYDYDYYIPST